MISAKGAPEALSEAHNPPVASERRRFEAAGVPCFADHIGGSDINVCRTVGDYDLGPPLKWRVEGNATPQVTADRSLQATHCTFAHDKPNAALAGGAGLRFPVVSAVQWMRLAPP